MSAAYVKAAQTTDCGSTMMIVENSNKSTTQRSNPNIAGQDVSFDANAASAPVWLSESRTRKPVTRSGHVAPVDPIQVPAAQVHQNAPELPQPTGPQASPQQTRRCVSQDYPLSSSMFSVLQTMTEGRQSDMVLAQLIKRMRTQSQMLSKQRDLLDKAEEIKASNTSATTRLLASGLATGLSGVAAWFFRYQDVGINQAVTGAFDYWDRTYGGQSRANAAVLEQKFESTVSQHEQTRVDAASAWYEQVKESRKAAQQSIMTHIQMGVRPCRRKPSAARRRSSAAPCAEPFGRGCKWLSVAKASNRALGPSGMRKAAFVASSSDNSSSSATTPTSGIQLGPSRRRHQRGSLCCSGMRRTCRCQSAACSKGQYTSMRQRSATAST
ncbi:hypothetical protein Q3G72_025869 [Acer saccharum]|nr:hypothetical protein Q3G72_025869 [Acer saccharum]